MGYRRIKGERAATAGPTNHRVRTDSNGRTTGSLNSISPPQIMENDNARETAMKKSERYIQNEVRFVASQRGFTMYRNNVGAGWQGSNRPRLQRNPDGSSYIVLMNPRRIKFGLKTGSGDLIGYRPTVITQDMVGQTVAIFASVEIKTKTGTVDDDQSEWAEQVAGNGGISIIARGPDDIPND